jgi:hypothetical protein
VRVLAAPALAVALALFATAPTGAADAPSATIAVSAATAGSGLSRLVQGTMQFRDQKYLLTLHGVTGPVRAQGEVYGLTRPRDIEGVFKPSGGVLRNSSGVSVRFDPPLALVQDKLEIELSAALEPKVSRGHRQTGVD